MNMKIALTTTILAAAALATSATSLAATKTQINRRVSATLVQFDTINPENITLANKAAGVLVFPRVTKGGIGVGGEYGEGALQVNGKTVGFYSVGSASVGLTLGLA
jgi:lipid-binding SYLF domain-containing protein